VGSTQRQAALRREKRAANPKPYRFVTEGLRRLLRIIGEQADGLERLDRATMRRDRRCVGCEEADGVRFEAQEGCSEPLGWVCAACDEVIELVYEKEIEEVEQARAKLQEFLDAMDRVGFSVR